MEVHRRDNSDCFSCMSLKTYGFSEPIIIQRRCFVKILMNPACQNGARYYMNYAFNCPLGGFFIPINNEVKDFQLTCYVGLMTANPDLRRRVFSTSWLQPAMVLELGLQLEVSTDMDSSSSLLLISSRNCLSKSQYKKFTEHVNITM